MKKKNVEDEFETNVSNTQSDAPIRFSPNWLRSFKGCEHYSDEEALDISENLRILAIILLETKAILSLINNNQTIEHKILSLPNKNKTR